MATAMALGALTLVCIVGLGLGMLCIRMGKTICGPQGIHDIPVLVSAGVWLAGLTFVVWFVNVVTYLVTMAR